MDWLKNRVVEVSTWRGVGGLLVALGLVSAGQIDLIISAGLALVSVVEVIRKEREK